MGVEIIDPDDDTDRGFVVNKDVTLPMHGGANRPEMGEPVPEGQMPEIKIPDDADDPEIGEEEPGVMEVPVTDVGPDGITRILDDKGNLPPGLEDKDRPDLKSPPFQYYN